MAEESAAGSARKSREVSKRLGGRLHKARGGVGGKGATEDAGAGWRISKRLGAGLRGGLPRR